MLMRFSRSKRKAENKRQFELFTHVSRHGSLSLSLSFIEIKATFARCCAPGERKRLFSPDCTRMTVELTVGKLNTWPTHTHTPAPSHPTPSNLLPLCARALHSCGRSVTFFQHLQQSLRKQKGSGVMGTEVNSCV